MSTPSKYNPATNVQAPRCPYCSHLLTEVDCYNWPKQVASGLMMILAINCPNADCKKLLGTQMMLIPHEERSSIVGPH